MFTINNPIFKIISFFLFHIYHVLYFTNLSSLTLLHLVIFVVKVFRFCYSRCLVFKFILNLFISSGALFQYMTT